MLIWRSIALQELLQPGSVPAALNLDALYSRRGQLLWREFFITCGAIIPNFDRMEGNPICKQVCVRTCGERKGRRGGCVSGVHAAVQALGCWEGNGSREQQYYSVGGSWACNS